MSRLEDLIQTLCPDGVEFKSLGQICNITTGKLNANAMAEGGMYPFFTCAREVYRIDTYAFDTEALLVSGNGSQVGHIHYYKGKFNAYQRTYVLDKFSENIPYISHVLRAFLKQRILEEVNVSGVPYIKLDTLSDFSIPLPPLPVQEEIVRILDTFSGVVMELEQNLEAEQAARVRQYEHYRNQLFDITGDDSVSCIPLESVIISLKTGLNPRKNFQLNTEDAKNHYVTVRELAGKDIRIFDKTDKVNDEALRLINNRSNLEVNDILFSGTGTVGRTAIVQEPPFNWNIKEGVYVIKPDTKKINPFYLLYLLQSDVIKKKYEGKIVGSPVISLPMYELRKLLIPLPSLEMQEQIVSILDRFDALVNDLKSGLPAEIALRRKQYEYYRDKLLTFQPLK